MTPRPDRCPGCGRSCTAHTGVYCQVCGEPLLDAAGAEALLRSVRGRYVNVFVNEATEHRVRLYMDRFNRDFPDPNTRLELDDEEHFAIALTALVDYALSTDELEYGLEATSSGELRSREVMDEEVRRRRAH